MLFIPLLILIALPFVGLAIHETKPVPPPPVEQVNQGFE